MSLLEVKAVSMNFGGLAALKQVSFSLEEGEIAGLIGPNGAGKTTLFNCLSGFLPPSEGQVVFRGRAVTGLAPHQITALGMTRTFQTSRVFKRMTVMDHLLVGRHLHQRAGFWAAAFRPAWVGEEEAEARERGRMALQLFGEDLLPYLEDFADTLSYANKRRLEIARALVAEPKLLLLDEPTAGMNPHESAEVVQLMRTIQKEGVTVLLIEHDMKVIMGVSTRIVVLDHGEKISEGLPEEIRRNPDVIRAYMGRRQAGA
ncbi:MAG TPA: ABC transporter ATP-binding protein [Candidatus Acidoferrum sp.]|nr:ABC transporter ATP-binding protein [Candidatus Acidoferrum sp.]